MTEFRTMAANRYTTKKYDSTKKIPAELVNELKEILRLSPSSINSQPWQFTFVSDEAVKRELAAYSFFNAEKVQDSSHVVVFSVIDNLDAFEQQVRETLPEPAVNYYLNMVKPGSDEQIKNWLSRQVYLSLGFFLSGVGALGIDSTPMEGIDGAGYDRVLKTDGYRTLFAVALGYRDLADTNQPSVRPKSRIELDKVVRSI